MAVRRFKCDECGVSYAKKLNFEAHLRTHGGKKSKKDSSPRSSSNKKSCDECGGSFASAALLKKHDCSKNVEASPRGASKRPASKQEAASVAAKTARAADDALKAHMSTKVLSLFDGSKKEDGDVQKKTRNVMMPGSTATSPLSASGIRNMSLSIKQSLDKFKNKNVSLRKSDRSSTKKVTVVASNLKKALSNKLSSVEAVAEPTPSRRKAAARKSLNDVGSEPSTSPNNKDTPPVQGRTRSTRSSITVNDKAPVKRVESKGRAVQKKTIAKKVAVKRGKKNARAKVKVVPKRQKGKKNSIEKASKEKDGEESAAEANEPDDIDFPESGSDDSDESFVPDDYSVRDKVFTCAHCSKKFTRKYHLDRHLRSYPCSGLPPPQFTCELCNRAYTRKDNLREHLRTHTGEGGRNKKYKCNHCGKAFHGMSLLTIHERKHTGEKPFHCDFCPKQFPSAGALTKHRRTHTGEKPFACPECGFKFALKGTLNRHLRVHSGVRPHQCPYCGKRFIQIGGLKAHLFYHTGENAFKCEDCGKIFNRKARLQMHQLYVHIKSKPYECAHCSKAFTRKEDLNRHAILHTGQKPYKCPTCGKSFAIKPSLKLHLLTHTKEEPRSCHECGRAFIRKDCLLRHMRKRHRDLLDKILLAENDEKFGEPPAVSSRMLSEQDLCENIQELLRLLVEESTLLSLGWPTKPVHEVLEAVIRRCGHVPVNPEDYVYIDRMRENAKLLFTVVIDDNAVKTLLNNQTVDEVILHVLRLAKT